MNTKGIAHAIAGIESELENLKAHAGISMDTGEEDSYEEPKTREVGRGRKKKTIPSIAEEESENE